MYLIQTSQLQYRYLRVDIPLKIICLNTYYVSTYEMNGNLEKKDIVFVKLQ